MAFRMDKSPLARLRMLFLLFAVLDGAWATRFCQTVVEPLGYGCSEYSVQTDDGFVLVMHRLNRVDSMAGKGHKNTAQQPFDSRNNVAGMGNDPGSDPVSRTGGAHSASNQFLRCNDGTTQGATSSASAHPAYPDIPVTFGCRNTDPQTHNFDSLNGPTAEGVQPIFSSGPTPAPDTSVSLNRAPEDSSTGQASIGVGPAPSSTHDASVPQQTISGSTSSIYTSSPEAGKGSPVMLMHMEFFSGDSWFQNVDADRHVSHLLPLMLVEDGFDVWIGHQRATYWGHGHAQFKPTDRAYWDWTWDQHVQYDLPAQLRFISTETNRHIHFIGASQAATVGAAAATDEETAKMIRSLTLIGPTAFRGNSKSFLLNAWAYFFGVSLDTTYYTTGFQNGAFNYTSEFPRSGPISGQGLTGMTIGLISGPNCCLGSASVQMTNGWDGTTSFKNLLHWQQGIRTNRFQQFDYGTAAGNLKAYGQPTPPAYNAADIPSRLPILIIGGGRDWYAPPNGTNNLMSQMQKPATLVNLTNYAHFDLYFSFRRETDIYMPILQFLEGPEFK